MVSKKFIITNEAGIHMRPAERFVSAIQDVESEVTIRFKGMDVNAKSIMILMAACIRYGDEIEVICEGPEEERALRAAEMVIESGFRE